VHASYYDNKDHPSWMYEWDYLNRVFKQRSIMPVVRSVRHWFGSTMVPIHLMPTCLPMSSGWTVMAKHFDTTSGWFPPGQLSVNADNPSSSIYGQLDKLDDYKSLCTNTFHFRLVYPGHARINEWRQGSNPATSTTITGYQRKKTGCNLTTT